MILFDKPSKRPIDDCRPGNAGFLLVETLATMTISAFILVGLLSVVALTMRASEKTSNTSQKLESTSRVISALAREVEQITPLRWAGKDAGFVFSGTDQSLIFAREVPLTDGAADDQVVFLQGVGNQLFRKQAALLPGDQSVSDLIIDQAQEILQGRFRVRFAYFAPLANGQEALVDHWENANQLPVAIRISLADSNGVPLGATRVPVLVDAEPGCAAPGKGLCSFVPIKTDDTEQVAQNLVDPNDELGWLRFAK